VSWLNGECTIQIENLNTDVNMYGQLIALTLISLLIISELISCTKYNNKENKAILWAMILPLMLIFILNVLQELMLM